MANGLDDVVAADTILSDVDGLNGRLVIRGYLLDQLAGRTRYHEAVSLLFGGFFKGLPTGAALAAALGQARSDVYDRLSGQIGTLASDAVQFENLSLDFYSEMLFQQKDAVPAELKIVVKEEGELVTETMWNLELHSPNTWLWSESSQEILAAFVQPNHPSIRPVLDEAVKILKQQGESTSLSGYQNLSHVRPMAMAIYQAMLNQQITYSNPPLFWDLPGGQRIRDAQTILDEKVGTCLDTAILFASLLEAVGLW